MTGDIILGRSGCSFDEIVTEFILRDGTLVERCWGGEYLGDPARAVAELERSAEVSREMAAICRGHGPSGYSARALTCEEAARTIREAFQIGEKGEP